ncbi:putative membrane protein SpoIIM required for sporulation [Granulicella aggregans]|uniref:Putative membrane protein SpoIIM required for sporulation n=1 Tax=Granulicella aggregans TaxID=474949 RepID=A0A7W8E2Q3_9BACT|nr:stage II sporulation protein M [Granulicella aggregans]MBB5057138.1 putative membrane protein SpoIIM required for sporulation [Granulicella aggregans]
MISNRWIALRKENWSRLEMLLQQIESGGLKVLSGDELRDLGLLYRQAAADLSAARADDASRTLEAYLNKLVSRAHNFVYSGRRLNGRAIWQFFAVGYPRLFRQLFPYTAVALLIFLAGGVLGAILTAVRPNFMHAMLGPQMVDTIEHHKMWTDSILSAKPQASSAIMTNNIGVCFTTFAGGIFAGLGTIWLLFQNGLSMGVISTACGQHHMALSIWSFVAAHGALELPSIFISGGAGLRLATGLLFPGMVRRKDALALAGGESIRLLAGTIPMLTIAGILEAFLSPSGAPVALKFSVCALLLVGLSFWLSEGGRTTPIRTESSEAVKAMA